MKEEIRKELESMNSPLADERFKKEFDVPEGFFEKMQDSVIAGIKPQKTENHGVSISLRRWLYASAAIIVIALGALFVFNQLSANQPSFERIETEVIFAYLDDHLEEISVDMLVTEETNLSPMMLNDLSDELIEDYLEENLEDLPIEELENLL